jgi:hypothetical protein
MGSHFTGLSARTRASVASIVVAATLSISLAVGVGPSAASSTVVSASPSAFCTTIFSYHATAPKGTNYTSYHAWAKTYLPFFSKLASEAPNAASKSVLTKLVSIMKYEATVSNAKALAAYIAANQTKWVNGWKSFAAAVLGCAKALA